MSHKHPTLALVGSLPRQILLPAEFVWAPVFASLVTTSSKQKLFDSDTQAPHACLDAQNSKDTDASRLCFLNFVRPVGVEPTTVSLRGSCSTN